MKHQVYRHNATSFQIEVVPGFVLYISYNTIVAARLDTRTIRIESPSRTTSKHMTMMGCKQFDIVTEQELSEAIEACTTLPRS